MRKIFAFSFLVELIVAAFWSCWSAALLGSGHSIASTATLLASLYIAQTIFELPTGYFADRWGRKLSTLLGVGSLAIGFLLLGLVKDQHVATIGFFLAGLGLTLNSGARTSWLLGLASAEGRVNTNESRESFFLSLNLAGRFATILGAFGGVALLKISPGGFWIAASVVAALTVFFGLLSMTSDRPKGFSDFEKITFAEFKSAARSVPYLLAVTSILFFGIETGIRNLVNQPYVLEISHGNANYLAYFQGILATVRILGILFYRSLSASTKQSIGKHFLILPLFAFALAELFASKATGFWPFLVVYGAAVFTLGWHFPLRDAFINSLVPEKLRASLLSFDSMMANLGSAAVLLCLGGVASLEIRQLWNWGAGALVVSAVGLLVSHRRSVAIQQ